MFFFAFSTIIGWYFFGETNVKYLFGKKAVPVYTVIVILFVHAALDCRWILCGNSPTCSTASW